MHRVSILIALGTSLALAACAPASDEDEAAPSLPLGYELAMAKDSVAATEVSVVEISVDELAAKLEAGNIRLIDVRTDEEVAEAMIPGAEHIALDRFDPASLDLSDGREVVLYCRSARRSGIAAERLAAQTGKPAQHLAGGILAWQEAGKPVTSD